MSKPDIQFGGDASQAMGEEPVAHGGIEKGRGNASVRTALVALAGFIQIEVGCDAVIGPESKDLTEPSGIGGTAENTIRMQLSRESAGRVFRLYDTHLVMLLYHVPAFSGRGRLAANTRSTLTARVCLL